MDKESIYELQKIDCNCNDCIFMVRDFEKFKTSLAFQEKMQFDYYNVKRNKLLKAANDYKKQGFLGEWNDLLTEAESMKFVFDKSGATINFGECSELTKPVSFIPNTLQLETQNCFSHRKDLPK